MARSDGNYFVIRGYMDGEIMGERSFDTQQEAEFYGKRMLDAIKSQNPKAKKIVVDIDSTVKHAPGPKIKTLASRPGAKDMMAREVVARKGSKRVELSGPNGNGQWVVTVMQEEKQVVPGEANDRFVDSKFYSTEAAARRAASKMLASRPGAKATFKVEDRFYFGKGRKERFADDAKQIADTILKQLGGGRFIAMTGAKNFAFSSNPPGLHMSIGRGTKDGIKYLRVDYDRGSDTYNMIFANKSGSTVKSVNHVQANALQRVFTSTTGFDTHL